MSAVKDASRCRCVRRINLLSPLLVPHRVIIADAEGPLQWHPVIGIARYDEIHGEPPEREPNAVPLFGAAYLDEDGDLRLVADLSEKLEVRVVEERYADGIISALKARREAVRPTAKKVA